MNLIDNAYFLGRAGESVPVGNHFTCVGDVLSNSPDPRIVEIDEVANDIKLLKDSSSITIKAEREGPFTSGNLALSFYAKGNMKDNIIITISLYNVNDSLLSYKSIKITPNKSWERFEDILFEVTDMTTYVSVEFENDSSEDYLYIAMPQLEEGNESTEFEVGG